MMLVRWTRAALGAVTTLVLAAIAIAAVAAMAGLLRLDTITTGSMEPALSPGDLVVMLPTDADRLVEGDVVALRSENLDAAVAHRIADIDETAGTVRLQGDANSGLDPEIYDLSDAPRVVVAVPRVGAVALALFGSPTARMATGTAVLAAFAARLLIPRRRREHLAGLPHTVQSQPPLTPPAGALP